MSTVFISGATGYLGRPLSEALIVAGYNVYALTRPQSIRKLPVGCTPVIADALDASTFVNAVPAGSTFIHLTGVSHPSPAKAAEFRTVDQTSFEASLKAARSANVKHFIYVSVAQPAPVMRAYTKVRRECELLLVQSGLNAAILRPWYVLGPGHRWPCVLIPIYKLVEQIPAWREIALRLGLVTHQQMLRALIQATVNAREGIVYCDVPAIRAANCVTASALPSVLSPARRDLSA
jgi:uncharacterized protein YbjT (DUF2867 family)